MVTPRVLKQFFRDNFVIFRRSTAHINEFSIFVWSCDHFSAPFMGLYLPNAWSQTLQTSKRQSQSLQSLGFSSVPLVWGKTVSCRLYAGSSKGTLKREKCYFWGSGSAHAKKIPEFFTIAPVLTSTLTVCSRNRGDSSSLQGAPIKISPTISCR